MATITPKLTVTGTAADWGAAVAISASNSLICEAPAKGLSKLDVPVGTKDILVNGSAGTAFVYIKNNNTSGTGYVDLKTDEGNVVFGTLMNGEFAWIPIDSDQGIECTAVNATVEVEYAYWSRTA